MQGYSCQVFQVDTLKGLVVGVDGEAVNKQVNVELLTPVHHSKYFSFNAQSLGSSSVLHVWTYLWF